jgi:hypothetical protein
MLLSAGRLDHPTRPSVDLRPGPGCHGRQRLPSFAARRGLSFQIFNLCRAYGVQNVEFPMLFTATRCHAPPPRPGMLERLPADGCPPPQRACPAPAATRGHRAGPGELSRLILADEPTGNLELPLRAESWRVDQLPGGRTMVSYPTTGGDRARRALRLPTAIFNRWWE